MVHIRSAWNEDMDYRPTRAMPEHAKKLSTIDRLWTWIIALTIVEIICHPWDYLTYVWAEFRNADRQMVPQIGEITTILPSTTLKPPKTSGSYAKNIRKGKTKR